MSSNASGNATDPDRLAAFFRSYYETELAKFLEAYDPDARNVIEIDYTDLFRYDQDLADDYLKKPEKVTDWLEDGIASIDWQYEDLHPAHITVRVSGLPPHAIHDVGDYDPRAIDGSFAGIRGQVSKRTQKKQIFNTAAFECVRCGTHTVVPQGSSETLDEPHECDGCERNGPFNIAKDHPESDREVFQKLRLQLPPEKAARGTDDTIDVTLNDDLVDQAEPGDRLVVNGTVESELVYNGQTPTRVLELGAKADSIDMLEADFEDIDIEEHRDRIEEIADQPEPIEDIVASIAPSIRGRDAIKEAIAYQMFGGVEKDLPDGAHKRGTLHLLLVGDPGCGKSAILKYAKRLSPRAVYTSGKGSTAAGLTAAAVQDDFGDGGWTLEAGALVEAHKGLAAIDEFDKMHEEDQSGVMQAMSEQEISLSKAGINATLPAKTTVLAAANPRDGRFDQYEAVAEQIDLDPALFSRFDLVFTISDSPDAEMDADIASHMTKAARVGQQLAGDGTPDQDDIADVEPPIEPEVMQAYIAHARSLTPVLSHEAEELIVEEYVSLRTANDEDGPIPTTARMTEALIRLAEASARIRLNDEIAEQDAERAIAIHRRCLQDVGVDPETGEFDTDVVETGTSKSQRDRINFVRETIRELDDKSKKGAGHEPLVELGEEQGYSRKKIEHAIDKLKRQGVIYEPIDDRYRPS